MAKSMFPSSWYPQSLRQSPAGMEAARKILMNAEYVVRVYVTDINITGGRSAYYYFLWKPIFSGFGVDQQKMTASMNFSAVAFGICEDILQVVSAMRLGFIWVRFIMWSKRSIRRFSTWMSPLCLKEESCHLSKMVTAAGNKTKPDSSVPEIWISEGLEGRRNTNFAADLAECVQERNCWRRWCTTSPLMHPAILPISRSNCEAHEAFAVDEFSLCWSDLIQFWLCTKLGYPRSSGMQFARKPQQFGPCGSTFCRSWNLGLSEICINLSVCTFPYLSFAGPVSSFSLPPRTSFALQRHLESLDMEVSRMYTVIKWSIWSALGKSICSKHSGTTRRKNEEDALSWHVYPAVSI